MVSRTQIEWKHKDCFILQEVQHAGGGLSVQDGDPKVSSWASFKAHEGNSRVDDFYLNLLRPQACLKFLKFLNEMCIYFLTFYSRFLGSGVLLTGKRENLVISFTISQASCKISCLGDLYPDIKGVNSLLKIVKPPHQPQKEGKQCKKCPCYEELDLIHKF